MFTLLAAGTAAFWLTIPISVLIVVVLGIIVVSYRQTIRAYPNGGGSYIVARENLGQRAGLVAAAALLVDYVLTVSVSVAAGVAAITSAFPGLSTDLRVPIATACILAVMLVNLRGIRESGTVFADPDLRLPGVDAGAHRHRHRPDRVRRPAAGQRRHSGRRPGGDARAPAADARLRRRLQRHHRGRGRVERGAGVPDARVRATRGRRSRSWARSSASCSSAARTSPASSGPSRAARDGHLADRARGLRDGRRLLHPPARRRWAS